MFQKGYFSKDASRKEIIKSMEEEGFKPKLINDKPNFIYKTHQHPETKLLVCLEGSMKVKVENKEFNFEPCDKLKIPENTLHSDIVGNRGCIYFWSEKII